MTSTPRCPRTYWKNSRSETPARHACIPLDDDGRRPLSPHARALLTDPANQLLLSGISGLEMAIKIRLGKLRLDVDLQRFLSEGMDQGRIEELPVRLIHTVKVAALPLHHRDPFDRLLIAQAQTESIPLLTEDSQIERYEVRVIW